MTDNSDLFTSLYGYDGQREDILSLLKGQAVLVLERPSDTWWVAELDTGEVGYVPAAYLKELSEESRISWAGSPPPIKSPPLMRCKRSRPHTKNTPPEQCEGLRWVSGNPVALARLEQQEWSPLDLSGRDAFAREKKREAMEQLMVQVVGEEWESGARKPLEDVLTPPLVEDVHQIESRRITNPILESQPHKQLQQELVLRNRRGELRNERSELDRVLQARKRETEMNQLRGHADTSHLSNTPAISPELFLQLQKRTQHLQQVEEEEKADQSKPEFLKIKLRKAPIT